jgi:hypothetical protein
MKTIASLFLWLIVLSSSRVFAQSSPAAAPTPPLRRWFEIQTLTGSLRYRVIENSDDVVTANHLQYRDVFRARVNLDERRRYTVVIGGGSGSVFTSAWNISGLGTGVADYHDNYMKQLFADVQPVDGLELQYGGFYVIRGESTEYTSYDEDGFLVGERVSVRRPKQLWLDEISVTRGQIGPYNVPNLHKRWDGLKNPDYWQALAAKRFNQFVAASADYSTQAGEDTIRAAIALRFKPSAPISALRYEQYSRVNRQTATGFAVTVDRPLPRAIRLQGGYATIDGDYNGWNSDRIQRGRRVFAVSNIPIAGPLSAQVFITHAFHSDFPVALRTRFDALVVYDAAAALRKTGVF